MIGFRRSLHLVTLLLLTLAQPLRDRGSSRDQRGLVGEPLGKVGVILLHDIEHGFPGEPAVVLGQESVQVSEFFVVHLYRASAAMAEYTATCRSRASLLPVPDPGWLSPAGRSRAGRPRGWLNHYGATGRLTTC
ncbi:hypothetical protein ACH79_37510 [Bradyrhizobium sp. CCBAU 051011]|nr:hypothetical protein ACH79_37510 [Bradyrhizobium sp. CCBAU 051011]